MQAGESRSPAADAQPGGGVLATGRRCPVFDGQRRLTRETQLLLEIRTTREERSKLTTKRILSKRGVAAGAVMLLGAGLAACSSSSTTPATTGTGSSTASSNTSSNAPALVMESSPEETLTDNFNPFDGASPIQGMGATGLVYEPLLTFDLANPAVAPYPMLATGYTWGAGGKSI